MGRRIASIAVLAGIAWGVAAAAGDPPAEKKEAGPYDPKADAKAAVASALEKARRGGKRVLIVYGGNWCGWCLSF